MELSGMSKKELLALRYAIDQELGKRISITYFDVEYFQNRTGFVIGGYNLTTKTTEIENIFKQYGDGQLYYYEELPNMAVFCFDDYWGRNTERCILNMKTVHNNLLNL